MRALPLLLTLSLILGACVDPHVVEDHSGLGTSEIGSYFRTHDIDEGRDVDLAIRSMVLDHLRRSGGVLSPVDQKQLGVTCDPASTPRHCTYDGVDRVRDAPHLFGSGPRRSNVTSVHVLVALLAADDAEAHVTVKGRTLVTRNAGR